ncbi:putative GDP-mannose 4,6 dehydratase 1-like [Capsicum annuum]|nr:putative GDP-mannose 4,6 dehydratase 1-like [Capsicum annuum]
MGASESVLSSSQRPIDEITTVSERLEGVDPILERLKSLKIASPILKSPPAESSLTDILVRKTSSTSNKGPFITVVVLLGNRKYFRVPQMDSKSREYIRLLNKRKRMSRESGCVDPKVLLELFSVYRQWQEEKAQKICKRQEEIENKIEVADALAVKLLQRFNYSVSAMKTTSQHLSEVNGLQVELGVLKGRLTEVISNCDALCKRIDAEGPESLRSSIKPFTASSSDSVSNNSSSIRTLQAETDEKQ